MIRSNLPAVVARLGVEQRKRLEATGIVVTNNVKVKTPVDEGTLRAGQTYVVDGDAVYVGNNVPHGPFVELGTSKMRAQPHLVPGLMDSKDELRRIWGEPIL